MVSATLQIVLNYSAARQMLELYVINCDVRLAVFPFRRHYYHCKFCNSFYDGVGV
jgi:hypothetical protein